MVLETANLTTTTSSPLDVRRLRELEGREISLSLIDGSRLDDVVLVSAGRTGTSSVWVFDGGMDVFVPRTQVVDAWASAPRAA
jgi:hypothetical protein